MLLLFQIYSGAVVSFVCPPLLAGLLGNYLHNSHGWDRAWLAGFILLGLLIGFSSTVSYLKKTQKLTSARSRRESDSPYRIHRNDKSEK